MTEGAGEGLGWRTALKVALILLVGLVVMVAAPFAIARAEPGGFGWAVLFMLGIGGVALYAAFDELRQRRIMLNTPTSTVRSMAVEASVHVDDFDEPPAPIREFAETEAGQAILETEIPREEGQDSGVSGTVTDVVESTIQKRAKRHLTESRPHDRRYEERVLAVGESAYVFGGAYPREGVSSQANPENLVIREHQGTGAFIVSDKSEARQAEEGLVDTAVLLAIGIGLVPGGTVALLRFLGLM